MFRACTTSTKSGPGDTVTLLHGFVLDRALLKSIQCFSALTVQRDFHDHVQSVPQYVSDLFGGQHSDLTLNQSRVAKAFDPSQAGGGRCVDPLCQFLVSQGGIVLQFIQ